MPNHRNTGGLGKVRFFRNAVKQLSSPIASRLQKKYIRFNDSLNRFVRLFFHRRTHEACRMDNERLDVVLTCILRCAQDAARAWIFDSSLREDVAQEVGIRFIRYWRTSARNEDKERFAYWIEYDQQWQCDEQQCRSWVQLPVRQVFISRWRHKSVGDQFVENVKNGYHSNPIAIIEDDHETTEDIARLYEHITRLPPAQREILDLLLDGETAVEIASALKISSNAVSCRYCRAVRTLRDCFKHTSP